MLCDVARHRWSWVPLSGFALLLFAPIIPPLAHIAAWFTQWSLAGCETLVGCYMTPVLWGFLNAPPPIDYWIACYSGLLLE